MNDFEHVHPPVPDKTQFQIKVEEERKKKPNILDDSAKKLTRSFVVDIDFKLNCELVQFCAED